MRTIGLLGGMSWESTAVYYRRLNENVRDRLGGLRSAKVIMHSVDFESIVELAESRCLGSGRGRARHAGAQP